MPRPPLSSWFDHPNNIWWWVQITNFLWSATCKDKKKVVYDVTHYLLLYVMSFPTSRKYIFGFRHRKFRIRFPGVSFSSKSNTSESWRKLFPAPTVTYGKLHCILYMLHVEV
jgi:hypothetical protein